MKKSKNTSKLSLNKLTIAKLSLVNSSNIFGGDPITHPVCQASKAGSCNSDVVTKSGVGGGPTCQCPTATCTATCPNPVVTQGR